MSKNNNPVLPITIGSGIVFGVLWTLIAGSLWQWVPIMASMAAVSGVANLFSSEEPKSVVKKPPTKKGKK